MKYISLTKEENERQKQEIVSFIISLVGEENVVVSDRETLGDDMVMDAYIPSCHYAVELNGLYWSNELFRGKKVPVGKVDRCHEMGVKLFYIFEDEWRDKPDIVKSMITNALHKDSCRIYARKCEIRDVPMQDAKEFIDNAHIQGYCNSTFRYGLYYNGELVSVMTFGKHRFRKHQTDTDTYELLRFCNKRYTSVVGAAGKLLKHFIRVNKPSKIISYADRRYSIGGLYEKLGFAKYNTSEPSYFYVIDGERRYRFTYRKDVLIRKYGCPENMTEHGFCLSQKWYRIYDCGCLCYDMIL